MPPLTENSARDLLALLERENLPVPAALTRALKICDLGRQPPPARVLDMTDEALLTLSVVTMVQFSPTQAYRDAFVRLSERALAEAGDIIRDEHLDDLVLALRPRFDDAADVLHRAVAAGIGPNTIAADVINLDNGDALAVWKLIGPAQDALTAVAAVRERVTQLLNAAPTQAQANRLIGEPPNMPIEIDYSILYAAAVQRNQRRTPRNWLALAQIGLHLATNSEAEERLGATQPVRLRPLFVPMSGPDQD